MTNQDTAQFYKLDPLEFTKAPLRAEQTVTLNAPPEKVWAADLGPREAPNVSSYGRESHS